MANLLSNLQALQYNETFKRVIVVVYIIFAAFNGYLLFSKTGGTLKHRRDWPTLKRYYVVCFACATLYLLFFSVVVFSCRIPDPVGIGICRTTYILKTLPFAVMWVAYIFSAVYAYKKLTAIPMGTKSLFSYIQIARNGSSGSRSKLPPF